MRDLVFVGYLAAFLAMGLRRPFLFVLAYAYIDIVSPQRLSYWMLNSIPVSLIVFILAFFGWLLADRKEGLRFSVRQGIMAMLLLYCGFTTMNADFPMEALGKWDWVWKALVFAIFLPLTLRTKLRIEALALTMVLCASSIIITGGIKTLISGGGYGVLNLMIDDNSGLYEGSTISAVAIAIIPLILWLMKFGTIYRPEWKVTLFGAALIFACLLIPVGTEARTGLICIVVLAALLLRRAKRRLLYIGLTGVAMVAAVPFLPSSFTQRMNTIEGYQSDESASTRLAVWKWTIAYAHDNPLGGGFEAYLQNNLRIKLVNRETDANGATVEVSHATDQGRAYHSSYFEMLGEQGYPGLILWLTLHLLGLFRMEAVQWRYRKSDRPDEGWIAPLASALQNGHIIYMVGSLFIGIAFQPFIFMMLAMEIGLTGFLIRLEQRKAGGAGWAPWTNPQSTPATT